MYGIVIVMMNDTQARSIINCFIPESRVVYSGHIVGSSPLVCSGRTVCSQFG
jgi:hypothetical protein